ncbi:hypothetical protein BDZ94DRAFT_1298294 [Collybia nuda]|uniref:Uncharacterized protein n=1 Tax=Collybia nuda TaxID=64659 RepID=A0A9P5Y5Y0_9AGAR|nr:hypothetical protein BDZ94DRAFT_1298294 [Collybia nuda]
MSAVLSGAGLGSDNTSQGKQGGTSADVQNIFKSLKQSTDSILPRIDSLVSSGNATDKNVGPLVGELTASLNKTSSSLDAIGGPASTEGGPSQEEIAHLVSGIVRDITNTLDRAKNASGISNLNALLSDVDKALNQVLQGLEAVLAGVLKLVAGLLGSLAGALRSLNLGPILGTLGL